MVESGSREAPPTAADRPESSAVSRAPGDVEVAPPPPGRETEEGPTVHDLVAPPSAGAPAATDAVAAPLPAARQTSGNRPSIPGYAILDVLGRGGMGIVYKALQTDLNRLVALKMILAGAHAGPEERARFRREAEAVARLQHPNVVQIYQVGEQDGLPFFSLELAAGGSLADQLRGTPQPARPAAELAETLARAVQAAHERGIVHRDLKPANVLLTREGTPKITDFGLAKCLDVEGSPSATGDIMGTPNYMAPEQAAGKVKQIGPAADVWALGAILYELLTARPPFVGETALDTLGQVMMQEPVPPRRLQPKVPRDLETVCLECLRKEPAKRYASALALAEDLRRFLDGRPIQARPVGPAARALKWARRHPGLAGVGSALAATALGLFGVVLLSQHQRALLAEQKQRAAEQDVRVAQQDAHIAQQELAKRLRLEASRKHVEELVSEGRSALAKGKRDDALPLLLSARDQCGDDTELADLKADAERLLGDIESYLAGRRTYERFFQRRQDAIYYATLFTGDIDLARNRDELRAAAEDALAQFGVTVDSDGLPAVAGSYFTAALKEEITAECYELLLSLAEAEALPLPEQADAERLRQTERALRTLDRARRLGLETRTYHLRRERYLSQRNDPEGAAREREQAARIPAAGALDYSLLGDEQLRRGNAAAAAAAFEKSLYLQPNQLSARYFVGMCYLNLNRPEDAQVTLTVCLSRYPEFTWGYLLRGFAHGELGKQAKAGGRRPDADFYFEAADEDFGKAEQSQPRGLPELARYALHVNRATVRLWQGKFTEAEEELLKAIQLKPKQYRAYVNLALVYQQEHKLDKAVAELGRAIDLEPTLAKLYSDRAALHLQHRDAEAALQDYETITRLQSVEPGRLAEAQAERGLLLYQASKYRAALAAFDAALKGLPAALLAQALSGRADPKALALFARAHRGRAEALLALAEEEADPVARRERCESAVRSFDRCLKAEKPTAEVYRARGRARAKLGDYMGAADDYTLALGLGPDAATHAARGWVYFLSEAPKLALRDFEDVIELDPNSAEGYGGRGYVRAKTGQWREAAADAEEAATRAGKDPRMVANAARTFALVAGLAGRAAGSPDSPARALRARYEDRALQLLQRALGLVHAEAPRRLFWQQYIASGGDFAALRENTVFRQMARDYSGPAK